MTTRPERREAPYLLSLDSMDSRIKGLNGEFWDFGHGLKIVNLNDPQEVIAEVTRTVDSKATYRQGFIVNAPVYVRKLRLEYDSLEAYIQALEQYADDLETKLNQLQKP